MKYCLFYGSLKKGEYNFNAATQKYLKTMEISGYDLYEITGYPAAIEGDGKLIVELHEVDDSAFRNIANMETYYGYIEKRLNLDDKRVSMFVYRLGVDPNKKIKNGNWKGDKSCEPDSELL